MQLKYSVFGFTIKNKKVQKNEIKKNSNNHKFAIQNAFKNINIKFGNKSQNSLMKNFLEKIKQSSVGLVKKKVKFILKCTSVSQVKHYRRASVMYNKKKSLESI